MVKAFIQAARLRTLPLAIASIMMGSVLAGFYHKHNWTVTLLALFTAILLQVLSNFANDYGDFKKGTDDASRTDRALASGSLTIAQMKIALIVTSLATLVSGVLLLYVSLTSLNTDAFVLLLVGFFAIAAALKYTAGKNPYGYSSLGDVAVFVFFGLVSVLGVYYLQTNQLDYGFYWSILPASAIGLLAAGVLNVNNIRDIDGDLRNNKITLAVRLKKSGAEVYQLVLVLLAFISLGVFVHLNVGNNGLLMYLIAPLYIVHWIRLKSLSNTPENRPYYNKLLKFHVLLNLLLVIVISLILV